MKVQLKENDFNFENGKEKVWWAENATGHIIYPTSPMSPLPAGFMLCSTTKPKEMDRLFNRIHAQEREHNEKVIERLYARGREHYERVRSTMRDRLSSAASSDGEKNIIRETLKLMDERDHRMQENSFHGASAMQESERPTEGKRTLVN